MQKGRQSNLPPYYFRRNNLSLVGCSPAEPTSVLIEQGKIQSKLLYLQSVKKSYHLQPYHRNNPIGHFALIV